ncbi:MAG: hypothetical protein ACYTX0_37450 [Nostoc sp.]
MNGINDKRRSKEGIQEAWLVRVEEEEDEPNADSDRSKSSRYDISGTKHEQIRSDRNNDQRQNAAVGICGGDQDPGKIRDRLKLIEQSFLSYVRSHQQRLEARLDESRTLEENFLTSLQELEREIDSLTNQAGNNEHADLEPSSRSETTQTDDPK